MRIEWHLMLRIAAGGFSGGQYGGGQYGGFQQQSYGGGYSGGGGGYSGGGMFGMLRLDDAHSLTDVLLPLQAATRAELAAPDSNF